jgi:hypothetical protein
MILIDLKLKSNIYIDFKHKRHNPTEFLDNEKIILIVNHKKLIKSKRININANKM